MWSVISRSATRGWTRDMGLDHKFGIIVVNLVKLQIRNMSGQ